MDSHVLQEQLSEMTIKYEEMCNKLKVYKSTIQEEYKNMQEEWKEQEIEYKVLVEQYQVVLSEYQLEHDKNTRLSDHLVQMEQTRDEEMMEMEKRYKELSLELLTKEQELRQERELTQSIELDVGLLGLTQSELANTQTLLGKKEQDYQLVLTQVKQLQQLLHLKEQESISEIDDAVHVLRKQLIQSEQEKVVLVEKSRKYDELLLVNNETSSKNTELLNQVQQHLGTIGILKHQLLDTQSHLSQAMIHMKPSLHSSIDKNLISNLIIQFVNLTYGDSKRYEILNLMASILEWNDDDKLKVGLIRQTNPSPKTPSPTHNLMDHWISFLLSESTDNPTSLTQ